MYWDGNTEIIIRRFKTVEILVEAKVKVEDKMKR